MRRHGGATDSGEGLRRKLVTAHRDVPAPHPWISFLRWFSTEPQSPHCVASRQRQKLERQAAFLRGGLLANAVCKNGDAPRLPQLVSRQSVTHPPPNLA